MARIEITEESLRAAVDQRVFAQAVGLAGKVAGLSVTGPQVEATVDGADVSVSVGLGGLDGRCACPAPAPCSHAVAAVLAWVRAGNEEASPGEASTGEASPGEASTGDAGPDLAAELRAELDEVIGELAEEAGDCDPDDGWYPDTSDLEDLLDEVEDLADGAPDAARELAGHVAGRIRDVLAAANCLTDDLADALARAQELHHGPPPLA